MNTAGFALLALRQTQRGGSIALFVGKGNAVGVECAKSQAFLG